MMLLMSIVIFTVIEYSTVEFYISEKEANSFGVYPSPEMKAWGFEKGDRITTINGESYQKLQQLTNVLYEAGTTTYAVVRGHDTLAIHLNDKAKQQVRKGGLAFHINAPYKVTKILEHAEADHAGLQVMDVIVGIDGYSVNSIEEIGEMLSKHVLDSVDLLIRRAGDTVHLAARVSESGKLGFYGESLAKYTTKENTLAEALLLGLQRPFEIIFYNLKAIAALLTGEVVQGTSMGPVRITQLFRENSAERFFRIVAILLCAGIYYELLPLPRSAGLRMIPIFKEIIFKRGLSFKSYKLINQVVWAFIILGMMWNIFQDVSKLL